jgi:thioredoxin-related protein
MMAKTALGRFLLFGWILGLGLALAGPAGAVQWQSYTAGMDQAKGSDKSVLVAFVSKRCKACVLLEQNTFTSGPVASYMDQNFITIRVDTDEEEDVAAEYQVHSLPTIWFLEPGGRPVAPLVGYHPPQFFLAVLWYVKDQAYKNMSFDDYVKKELAPKE